MVRSERESTNEIARFGGLKLPIPAISNAPESEKQTPAQSLRGLFTDDEIAWVHPDEAVKQFRERKTNRRVASVSHRLGGTQRDSVISKGFLQYRMRHDFFENKSRNSLKILAIHQDSNLQLTE
jgi:hypothetical protein